MAAEQITAQQIERAAIALMDSQGNNPGEGSPEWEAALGNAEIDVEAVLASLKLPFVGGAKL